MQKVRVRVTKTDIAEGKQVCSETCAVSLAIKRRLVNKELRVYSGVVEIDGDVYTLPDKANEFYRKFDKSRSSVKPIQFTLILPNKIKCN